MTRKTIAMWATIMIFVFGITVIVYPLIFNPQNLDSNVPVQQGREVPLPSGPAGPGVPATPPTK